MFSCLFGTSLVLAAESPIDFSWEKIDGAVAYEVQVEELVQSDWIELKTEKLERPNYQGKLLPGTYRIKVRTYDKRECCRRLE